MEGGLGTSLGEPLRELLKTALWESLKTPQPPWEYLGGSLWISLGESLAESLGTSLQWSLVT